MKHILRFSIGAGFIGALFAIVYYPPVLLTLFAVAIAIGAYAIGAMVLEAVASWQEEARHGR